MKRLIIADVKSTNVNGKSSGHYFSLARNYIDLYESEFEVKVAGGPIYQTAFDEVRLFRLPYDSTEHLSAWKQKWRVLMNCRHLFKAVADDDVIVMQHSAAATFMIGIALFARRRNNIYVISYDTVSVASSFKRFWYRLAKRHIMGFLCSNERVAQAFKRPYRIVPDYIYAGSVDNMHNIPYSEKKYDFAMLGTIWPDKGVVEAVRHLAGTQYEVIVGGRPSSVQIGEELQKVCSGADNIKLHLGFVSSDDYDRWICESRYCLLNYQGTYSERSSGVVLDVLFRGVPVVGHRCFAMQFVEEEHCGFLFGDVNSFSPTDVMNEQKYSSYLSGIHSYLAKQMTFRKKVLDFLALANHKKRLLIFHPTIAPYRIDLFNDLNKAFDTKVCLVRRGLLSQKFDYESINRQFEFEPEYKRKGLWATIRFYLQNLRKKQPDVVIVHEFGIGAILALAWRWITRSRYKVVSMCDDSYDMVVNDNDFSRNHKLARRILAPMLDDIILVEPKVCDWYQSHYGIGFCFPIIRRETTIRNVYAEALDISRTLVAKHQLQGKKVYLFVGRLVRLKNVHTLIEAFHQAHLEDACLVIVGDGVEKNSLEELAEQTGVKVIFTGRLEGLSLYAWYNVADCFVLPSTQEAFGAVTNEALVAGCKCLISELAGSQCLIENGKNGFTFDPHSKSDLAKKLKIMNSHLAEHQLDAVRPSEMLYGYEHYVDELVRRL